MQMLALPPEVLSQVLEILGDLDLASLVVVQRVCKSFKAIGERILLQQPSGSRHGADAINPVFLSKFATLFHAVKDFYDGQKAPFRQLPWAAAHSVTGHVSEKLAYDKRYARHGGVFTYIPESAMHDSPYLRPEASWRRLSVTWGTGPKITAVDVVKVLSARGGTSMVYEQLDVPPASGLTMGLFYDLLASGRGTTSYHSRGWQLLPGKRLTSYDDWLRIKDAHPSTQRTLDLLVEDDDSRTSAVLFVTGLISCTRRRVEYDPNAPQVWEPRAIAGGEPIVLWRWKGCKGRRPPPWWAQLRGGGGDALGVTE
ncbi:hypothetical protein F4677DRAFT_25197 [Hypoxylon crocopeplum]|nr:hypothetical protein F4677DRAFT_25197 [Hypoxylon crocopeplum]